MTNDLASLAFPHSWYYAGEMSRLRRGPVSIRLGRRELVGFATGPNAAAVLDARCVHMGADLSRGTVAGGRIRCPMHEWEFTADGRCGHIPASPVVPDFARQACYPTAIRGGHVLFCNVPKAPFEAPFFDTVTPEQLHPARPFDLDVRVPWHMIAANGFDLQHFRSAHDRTLLEEPVVDQPSPFARRIRARFAVTGTSLRDRLTKAFSGPVVTMTVTSWRGTMVLVSAEFRRTTSYGMVCITPVSPTRTRLRTIVWVPRSESAGGRAVFDPVDAFFRRSFIRAFVQSDQERSEGIRYTPGTLIGADAVLADYFDWLKSIAGGEQWDKSQREQT